MAKLTAMSCEIWESKCLKARPPSERVKAPWRGNRQQSAVWSCLVGAVFSFICARITWLTSSLYCSSAVFLYLMCRMSYAPHQPPLGLAGQTGSSVGVVREKCWVDPPFKKPPASLPARPLPFPHIPAQGVHGLLLFNRFVFASWLNFLVRGVKNSVRDHICTFAGKRGA